LPLANTFDEWALKDRINRDLGQAFFEAKRIDRKKILSNKIKDDKEFFIEIVKALKEANFDYYDTVKDSDGLHRWVKDVENL
jgi:heterodisulfide reductase subunit B